MTWTFLLSPGKGFIAVRLSAWYPVSSSLLHETFLHDASSPSQIYTVGEKNVSCDSGKSCLCWPLSSALCAIKWKDSLIVFDFINIFCKLFARSGWRQVEAIEQESWHCWRTLKRFKIIHPIFWIRRDAQAMSWGSTEKFKPSFKWLIYSN